LGSETEQFRRKILDELTSSSATVDQVDLVRVDSLIAERLVTM